MEKQTNIEKNTEVFMNYLKENAKVFETEKIKEVHFKLQGNSKENLRETIYLGGLFEGAKARFLSAEAKQERKNLGLKISVKYFIEQNFNLSESYVNRLIKGFNLKDNLETYLETGHVGKPINIDNFVRYCNPKSEAETTNETETAPETAPETATAEDSQQTSFGGVTLTLNKATKKDIEEAIAYLNNLVK